VQFIFLFALGAGLLVGDAAAQQAPSRRAPPPTAAEISPVDVVNSGSQRTVNVPVGKARLIRLPVPVRDVAIGDSAVADLVIKTPQLAYLVGRQVGNTNAFFLGPDGKEVLRLEIKVEVDVVTLRDTIESLMPGDRIEVKAVNQSVFLTGSVRSAAVSERARTIARRFVQNDTDIVNLLLIKEEAQVLLKVRVAEVQRNAIKELGVNFNAAFNTGKFTGSLSSVGTAATQPAFGFGQFAYLGSNVFQFTSAVNALERAGLIRTLAEPNLTAISGEGAQFLVGGEFPVPVSSTLGQVSITFKQFGIALNFTPVVLDQGRISLKVATEVSALSNNGAIVLNSISVPALTVRRAQTTVEMSSGGTLMIAGLLQNDINSVINGLPGLKDIPILGQLFRSESFQKNETELVVSVTGYLVKPMGDAQVSLPVDGYQPPSDLDFYLLGRLHARYTTGAEGPRSGQLKGPIGYILE